MTIGYIHVIRNSRHIDFNQSSRPRYDTPNYQYHEVECNKETVLDPFELALIDILKCRGTTYVKREIYCHKHYKVQFLRQYVVSNATHMVVCVVEATNNPAKAITMF